MVRIGAAHRVGVQPRQRVALQALSNPKPVYAATVTDKVKNITSSADAADVIPPLPTPKPAVRKPLDLDVELPGLADSLRDAPLDLLIVGCGPAGLGTANLASERGLKVGLIDPYPLSRWPNNYGVWVDEFLELGFEDCFNKTWDKAAVVGLGPEGTESMKLDRPYGQVNRDKLKTKLMLKCIEQGVMFLSEKVDYVDHGPTGAESSKVVTVDGREFHARAVLDATGHARRLVEFEEEFTPGYQAAYGIMCEVESHPFPLDEMLFMDWRADHLNEESQAKNYALPTFLYAMPFDETHIFLEETSLVARPEVTFDELKDRMAQRLHALGIRIKSIEEDEYCLIPMGGVLPTFPQRTLGIGGTAGMVHPSTGFMVSKTLTSSDDLVEGIIANLEQGKKGEAFSDAVWNVVWPKSDLRLRTFMCFGMETLMGLDLLGTRRFFLTFFTLPKDIWSGFLSWNMTNSRLARMAYLLFVTFPLEMRINFFVTALPFMPSFILNFLAPNKNKFDSKPWGGLPELAAQQLSKRTTTTEDTATR